MLVYQNRLILLDHEVIHWADPAFDLGFSLTHLLSKAHHLPQQQTAFAAAAVAYWQVYAETLGDGLVASFNSRSPSPVPGHPLKPAPPATPWPASWPASPGALPWNIWTRPLAPASKKPCWPC